MTTPLTVVVPMYFPTKIQMYSINSKSSQVHSLDLKISLIMLSLVKKMNYPLCGQLETSNQNEQVTPRKENIYRYDIQTSVRCLLFRPNHGKKLIKIIY